VAFSAGGDGDDNPLELILDSERPNPPPDREQKKAPGFARFRGGRFLNFAMAGFELLERLIPQLRLSRLHNEEKGRDA
jgi:hypothetical protein